MRYFAYSAPLNSYVHHKITSTPVGARMVYPKAFSVLMAPDGDRPEDHDALVSAVRHGDILLFNGWYMNEGAEKIKKIYEEAVATEIRGRKSHDSVCRAELIQACRRILLNRSGMVSSLPISQTRFAGLTSYRDA